MAEERKIGALRYSVIGKWHDFTKKLPFYDSLPPNIQSDVATVYNNYAKEIVHLKHAPNNKEFDNRCQIVKQEALKIVNDYRKSHPSPGPPPSKKQKTSNKKVSSSTSSNFLEQNRDDLELKKPEEISNLEQIVKDLESQKHEVASFEPASTPVVRHSIMIIYRDDTKNTCVQEIGANANNEQLLKVFNELKDFKKITFGARELPLSICTELSIEKDRSFDYYFEFHEADESPGPWLPWLFSTLRNKAQLESSSRGQQVFVCHIEYKNKTQHVVDRWTI